MIAFNIINKHHTLPLVYIMLVSSVKFQLFVFYSELEKVCSNYVLVFERVNLNCI